MTKKLLLFTGFLSFSFTVYSQANLWWKEDGTNTATNTSAVGTSNNQALRFKSYGQEWMSISPTGTYTFNSLTGTNNGLLNLDANGQMYRKDYPGFPNYVLLGDGTFGDITSISGWTLTGNQLTTTKNVGIGTTLTPEKLTVNGNILANGSISGTSLNVVDIVTSGKQFKISTSICLTGIDSNDPTSRNELCGMNGDLFIQSEVGNNFNTVFHKGNAGKVGFGVIPTEDFHVGMDARFDGKVRMNKIISIDSVFSIGDSTLNFIGGSQNINGGETGFYKGLGLGVSSYGLGKWSTAIGYKTRANAEGSITIGGGYTNSFVNTSPYSLYVGFKSNLPTFVVTPANGTGTYGNVGINSISPQDRLQIGNDYTSVSFGRADFSSLNYGTAYMGFNASRTSSGWNSQSDLSSNGGGVIYSSVSGNMLFVTIPNTGVSNQTLTDQQIVDNTNLTLHAGGGVSIGTNCLPSVDYGLAVKGKIITEEVTVEVADAAGCWPDDVFADEYEMMTNEELYTYLQDQNHLPNIPSANEIEQNGMNTSEVIMGLLRNQEELTLRLLELDRQNKELKALIDELKNK